ncbi:unnamed protein product, partial [Phaeothamnion confervicola]
MLFAEYDRKAADALAALTRFSMVGSTFESSLSSRRASARKAEAAVAAAARREEKSPEPDSSDYDDGDDENDVGSDGDEGEDDLATPTAAAGRQRAPGASARRESSKKSRRKGVPAFLRSLLTIVETEDASIVSYHDGNVVIGNPQLLADTVLPKYFRHAKVSSFQRQLHYFGWKKIAGKRGGEPCVFFNVTLQNEPAAAIVYLKRRLAGTKGDAVLSSEYQRPPHSRGPRDGNGGDGGTCHVGGIADGSSGFARDGGGGGGGRGSSG